MTAAEIQGLLTPFVARRVVPEELYEQLAAYLDLLLRWNARTNLTAIREPREIVLRHFGESLLCGLEMGARLPAGASVLDFGSGAGFPGIPVQLVQPGFRVTLAESQNKKAAFLREAVRTLALSTEVWGQRVEAMPAERVFDGVMMRAVDDMVVASEAAGMRVAAGGCMAVLTTDAGEGGEMVEVPGSERRVLWVRRR